MIRTVELARGIAALLVVIFHANAAAKEFDGPVFAWLGFAEHGVDFFFVLSGFIIHLAHGHEIGAGNAEGGTVQTYLVKRFIRLLPPLWIIVLGWVAVRLVFGAPVDFASALRSVTLVPSLEPTIPMVVWTLRHEMLFYLVFAVLLAWPRAGAAVFAVWAAAACVQLALAATGRPVTGLASFFLSAYSLDFMIGLALGIAHRRLPFSPSLVPLAAALALLAALLTIGESQGFNRQGMADYISVPATWWTLVLGLGFAGVLHGLIRADSLVAIPPLGMALGAISYALYLIHTIANSAFQRIAILLPDTLKAIGAGQILLTLGGIAAAWVFHQRIELPLTRTLRHRLLPNRTSPAVDAGSMKEMAP